MNKDKIIKKYNTLFEQYGDNPKSLGWNKGMQEIRFKNLTQNLDIDDGSSILDFGCGFGDLYGYFQQGDKKIEYTGTDINEMLIKQGQTKYPDANLQTKDILNDSFNSKFDYIFSCGVHNIKTEDNYIFLENSVKRFLHLSKKAIVFHLLSDKVEYLTENSFHFSPQKVLDIAYKYTNRVVLDNSCMPFEFSIVIFKESHFDTQSPFYK